MNTQVLRERTASKPFGTATAKKPAEAFRLKVLAPAPENLAPEKLPEVSDRRPGLGIAIAVGTSLVLWAGIGTVIAAIF